MRCSKSKPVLVCVQGAKPGTSPAKAIWLSTRGNGCLNTISNGSCYLLGNPDLDPEISINKELGLEFNLSGYNAGVTWFRNDYKTKIVSGTDVLGHTSSGK